MRSTLNRVFTQLRLDNKSTLHVALYKHSRRRGFYIVSFNVSLYLPSLGRKKYRTRFLRLVLCVPENS